jgi:hypothetical protein
MGLMLIRDHPELLTMTKNLNKRALQRIIVAAVKDTDLAVVRLLVAEDQHETESPQ